MVLYEIMVGGTPACAIWRSRSRVAAADPSRCLAHALERLGRTPPPLCELERFIGPPLQESFAELLATEDASLVDDAVARYRDRFGEVGLYENELFPGIPELLRKKFESVREGCRGVPVLLKRVYVKQRESDIAPHLNDLLKQFPELLLGSYPRIGEESFHVLLTLESRDAGYVQRALDSLLERLPDNAIHRVE